MDSHCVYVIFNIVNQKYYIGRTNQSFKVRWNGHCSDTRRGSTLHFHRAIRLHGEENFYHRVLSEGLTLQEAFILEQLWIVSCDSCNPDIGYNETKGGDGSFGYKHSAESLRKIGEKSKGRICSAETRAKISLASFGRKHKQESKDKISLFHRGRHNSEESKLKQSLAMKGKPSPMLGKHQTNEAKEKLRLANLGRTASEETRQAILLAQRNRREREKKEKEFLLGAPPVSPPEPITIN